MKQKQISATPVADDRCHVCGDFAIDMVSGYERFCRVTSDCKPWPRGGRLRLCRTCGCVQKVIDNVWSAEVRDIYRAYSIYHQSEGVEQRVFEQHSGRSCSRSSRLLERLRTHVQLPESGRLLDVGCGNGALLRTFSRFAPRWSLAGTELDEKYRAVVESIDRVQALYTCSVDRIPGTFDLITLIHVLEHIPDPRDLLERLWGKLELNGLLVVQVPDYQQNPFDLVVADHCTHFTALTAKELIHNAGYEVPSVATDWVPRELTVIARKTKHHQMTSIGDSNCEPFQPTVRALQWLDSVAVTARELSKTGNFGVFGTSIAATWLLNELEGRVSFFLDEDQHRTGKTYMDRPVYPPENAPIGGQVFIALPTTLAEDIQARMSRMKFRFNCYIPE